MRLALPMILAGAVLIIFTGCKKNDDHKADIRAQLQGEWELRHLFISWRPDTTLAAGNGKRLAFSATSWFSNIDGQASGKYTIVGSPVLPTSVCGEEYAGGYDWKIDLINGTDTIQRFVKCSGDTLLLRAGCFAVDGGRLEQYLRISDEVTTF